MSDRYSVRELNPDIYGFEYCVFGEVNGCRPFICGCSDYEYAKLIANALNAQDKKDSNKLSFNSVSGTLVKSSANSKMTRFHLESKAAEKAFSDSPTIFDTRVEILQVMLCGDKEFLVEYQPVDNQ